MGQVQMKRRTWAKASVAVLIDAYKAAAVSHGEAIERGDPRDANRHNDTLTAIYRELRKRGARAQRALMPLLLDPDDRISCWAAAHGLQFATRESEAILLNLAAGQSGVAFDARMTLHEWHTGHLSLS
jgi:hypothetical protein